MNKPPLHSSRSKKFSARWSRWLAPFFFLLLLLGLLGTLMVTVLSLLGLTPSF